MKALAKAQELDPQSASIHFLRAKALEGLGRHNEAQNELATVAKMQKTVRDDLERNISGREIPNPDLDQH